LTASPTAECAESALRPYIADDAFARVDADADGNGDWRALFTLASITSSSFSRRMARSFR
jgi:hypothetical protein